MPSSHQAQEEEGGRVSKKRDPPNGVRRDFITTTVEWHENAKLNCSITHHRHHLSFRGEFTKSWQVFGASFCVNWDGRQGSEFFVSALSHAFLSLCVCVVFMMSDEGKKAGIFFPPGSEGKEIYPIIEQCTIVIPLFCPRCQHPPTASCA